MKKKYVIKAKIYFKNGTIQKKKIKLSEDNDEKKVDNLIKEIKTRIRKAYDNGLHYSLEFGDTIFDGSEIMAIDLKRVK